MPTLRSYITGFALSVILTLCTFGGVWLHTYTHHSFPTHPELMAIFVGLALLQLVVQLVYFLHIGSKHGAHWRVAVLGFAVFVVVVVVGGTLWIMSNLQYNAMNMSPFINNDVNVHNEQD